MDTSLTPERAQQIRTLFGAVVALDPDDRAAYLDQACPDDADLRREVEALLEAHHQADAVLHNLDHTITDIPDRLLDRTVSHYQIVEKLGGGGMGVVYRATDTKLDRAVALKFLPPHLSLNDEAKQRFIHEAKAASALDHNNICTIHEIGESDDGQFFIAMAYYRGETLKKKIARGPLPLDEALDYAAQVAEGLAKAHAAEIIHRDIKPANVMLTEEGVVKIVDFGLAKMADVSLTQTGMTLGTIAYMSPEQTSGAAVDARTDLWSLGVVLYEMLAGFRPFKGDYAEAIIYAVRHDAPEGLTGIRPAVPDVLAVLVEKLLRKDPDARYGQAEEVLADLRALQHEHEAGTLKTETVAAPSARWRRAWRYGPLGLLLLVLLLVGRTLLSPQNTPIDSVAVLPLANMTGNPEQAYIADGMTEELIKKLGQIKALRRVSPRTSVMKYKEAGKSVPEIGQELAVAAVVEGALRSFEEQVQIDIRLFDARTQELLWEQSFQRALGDILVLQNEVALAIAREIQIELTEQEATQLSTAPPVDPKAYRLYRLGIHFRNKDTIAERPQALAYFEQAIAIDSTFALAHAWRAMIYTQEGVRNLELAEAAAEQARTLNPDLTEAYVALGMVHFFRWEWTEAEAAYRQAMALNPGGMEAHYEYGWLLITLGRPEEARIKFERALDIDPTSPMAQAGLTWAYRTARQYDRMLEQAHKANTLESNNNFLLLCLGDAYLWNRMYEEAEKIVDRLLTVPEADRNQAYTLFLQLHLYARTGRQEEALAIIHEEEERWRRGDHVEGYIIPLGYAVLEEYDQASEWLERTLSVDDYDGFGIVIKAEPTFDPLRSNPRFQAVLEKMGLEG